MQNDTDGFGILRLLLDESETVCLPRSIRNACLSHIDARNIAQEEGDGCTPLMVAVLRNNINCAQTLSEHSASPHLVGPLVRGRHASTSERILVSNVGF